VLAGLLAVGLVAAWVVLDDVELSALGWASRVLPLLLLGGLLGDASDRLAAADARRRALEAAAQRHRDATEVNDTLVQGMAAAKWAFEAGRTESGLRTLTETLEVGHQLVSKLLREADMGLDGHRPPER
jgi:surface antigen